LHHQEGWIELFALRFRQWYLTICLIFGGYGRSAGILEEASMQLRVYSTEKVHCEQLKGVPQNPPVIAVFAQGWVPTAGWTHADLAPWTYVDSPKEGILDLDFVAAPPTGFLIQVFCRIAIEKAFPVPAWVRGIRVHSSTNSIVAMPPERIEPSEATLRDGLPVPWPFPWWVPDRAAARRPNLHLYFEKSSDGRLAMTETYPIIFDAASERKDLTDAAVRDEQMSTLSPWPFPWSVGPEVSIELVPASGQECHRFRLAEVKNWPEVKTTWELKCVHVFGKRICTKVPVIYHRTCTKFAYVDVCYPAGALNDISSCVTGAALASAVASVISDGSAAAGTFKAALEACLLAKGASWADQVSVAPNWGSECGPWH
jgi:hypothetical protein